jgi:dolichol-phosphate mannosyltransferase
MQISIVIPVYNEADGLTTLLDSLRRVLSKMDAEYEILFVDDGSTDRTWEIIQNSAASDSRIKVLRFSRNFGHQAAVTAGLDFVSGDVVIMDGDLQDPPELIPGMFRLYVQGYDVVSAQRVSRAGESRLKRGTAAFFYWIMRRAVDRRISPQVGDFRLLGRSVVEALRGFREQHRFMRGLIAWLGFQEAILSFDRPARASGTTKYSLLKMVALAWTAISSFSALPLRFGIALGAVTTAGGFGYFGYSLFVALVQKTTVPGWTSLVCLQIICFGTLLTMIGLVGDYVARIYEEAKQRPLYVVSDIANLVRRPVGRAIVSPGDASSPLGERKTGLARVAGFRR